MRCGISTTETDPGALLARVIEQPRWWAPTWRTR